MKRALLRHTVATVAYRSRKAVRRARFVATYSPDGTPRNRPDPRAHRRPLRLGAVTGEVRKRGTIRRRSVGSRDRAFSRRCGGFDDFLASDAALAVTPEAVRARSPTRWRTSASWRCCAGSKRKNEERKLLARRYRHGRVGAEQTAPKREFD
jgi:hypothetical protein